MGWPKGWSWGCGEQQEGSNKRPGVEEARIKQARTGQGKGWGDVEQEVGSEGGKLESPSPTHLRPTFIPRPLAPGTCIQ